MAEGSSHGRRRFSDKWGKHELDVLAVLSSAFPQWLTSRQIAQRVKAYADSYGELADQAAKAAFAKQFQRDRAKLTAMGIAIESRQPEYSSKSEGQDFASYRLQLGDEPRTRMHFEAEELPILAAANYLARSLAMSAKPAEKKNEDKRAHKSSRTQPHVAQAPTPGLGLDSIAPGLGTQSIPENLIRVVDSRRFTATVMFEGESINVAYTDSDDLATYVLEHPGATIVSPQEAVDAFVRRLNAAVSFREADVAPQDTTQLIAISELEEQLDSIPEDPDAPEAKTDRKASPIQTGSEVDRRLRLMLFLSAHLGEEYLLSELAERFIAVPKTPEEEKKNVQTIRKDIGTLTTVSDDGELAGSQFFDIDWSLLEAEGIVSATNSLGLERLAGVSPQYLSLLTASISYLAHSPLMSDADRKSADDLYDRLLEETSAPSDAPWLSLTGYELEPASYQVVSDAISRGNLLDMDYTDGAGRTRHKLVAPAKIYVDEGVYYAAVWTGVSEEDRKVPSSRAYDADVPRHTPVRNAESAKWQTLRLARIGRVESVEPKHDIAVPDVPLAELREWNFENGTPAVFVTDTKNLPFIFSLPDAKVEDFGEGQKIHLTVSSDSWFVAFCIAHARHISAVGPATLQTMCVARAEHELSMNTPTAED
ncbi:helix-turn-helix transcriptional regulator [Alloscardovia macacae]|uniref:WYL domain-containing protein n=1 Tax=Alloscardovia macacae TaxID=1160091 RepID=A0A261F5P4_9BIFI|nr:WYL domain-containing protein [Alloscardovia macacae]OZG54452.1 WYL domain-containing protein [Alloscardovia macacae]